MQIAKALGAGEVTGVAGPANQELARSLGADRVLNHQEHDFTEDLSRYDIIFDAAGKRSFVASQDALRRNGRYVTTLPDPVAIITGTAAAAFSTKSTHTFIAKNSGSDTALVSVWLQAGAIRVVIDKTFPLQELAQAHRYNEQGHAAGKIVLAVE